MLGRVCSRDGLGRRYRFNDVVPDGLLDLDFGKYSVVHQVGDGLVDPRGPDLSLAAHGDM